MALQQEAGRVNTGSAFLLYRKDHVTLKWKSYDSYRAKSEQKTPSGIGHFFLFLNAANEPEKKQEIRGIGRKENRRRSGRIREKARNQGHWLEEKPKKKRTNRRKSRKSGVLTRRKAGGEADESEKKPEIVSIDQQSWWITHQNILFHIKVWFSHTKTRIIMW